MERENFDIQTPEELIKYIESWLPKTGYGHYADFYIGITNDVEKALLDDHGIVPEEDIWLYADVASQKDAEQVLLHFLQKGMQGALASASTAAKSVYCYVMTDATKQ